MQLKWLEDFIAYAETRSITRAADIRHVTHPAFSRRLKALEDSLGAPLIDRNVFPATLTADGEKFLDVARQMLKSWHGARNDLRKNRSDESRTFEIANGRTLARSVFPHTYNNISGLQHQIKIILHTTTLNDGLVMLLNDRIDAFICYASPSIEIDLEENDYQCASLGIDRLVAVSTICESGQPRFTVPAPGTKPVPYLAYAETMTLGRALSHAVRRRNIAPSLRPIFQSDMSETIHDLVRDGHGLAWLPLRLVTDDIESGRLVRVEPEDRDVELEIKAYGRKARKGLRESFWRAVIASLVSPH